MGEEGEPLVVVEGGPGVGGGQAGGVGERHEGSLGLK